MTGFDKWLIGMALVGGAAGTLATVILWMLLTRPLALVETVSRLL
jgi:hypothetical protein